MLLNWFTFKISKVNQLRSIYARLDAGGIPRDQFIDFFPVLARDLIDDDAVRQTGGGAKQQPQTANLSKIGAEKQVPLPPAAVPAGPPLTAPMAVAAPIKPPPAVPDEATWTAEERRAVQNALAVLGHLRGEADGNLGPATRVAIKQYQAFEGLPETGVLSNGDAQHLKEM